MKRENPLVVSRDFIFIPVSVVGVKVVLQYRSSLLRYPGAVGRVPGLLSPVARLFCALICFNVVTFAGTKSSTYGPERQTSSNPQVAERVQVLSDGEFALNWGETHSYRIDLEAGQFFYALVEQQGIDVSLVLSKPDGSEIAVTDSPNDRWGTEPVLLIADVSGQYRVGVRGPKTKLEGGHYQIKIVARREATSIDVGHAAAQRDFEEAQRLRSQPTTSSKRAAIEKYAKALSGFRSAQDTYRQALVVQMMAMAYAQLNEFRIALKLLDEALSLAQEVHDLRVQASVETLIGGGNDVLGDVIKSQKHYERALSLARQLNNNSTAGSALNNIGKLYNDAGSFQNALEYYLQALPLFKDLPGRRAITLNNIGVAYTAIGEPERAVEYLRQSLALLQAGNDKNAESYTLSNIGSAYSRLAKYEDALNYYNQARAIQQKTGNRAQEAETLDLVGVTYSAMGQPEKALEYHQQALGIQRATHNIRREALCLSNLGHVYRLLGQPDKAVEHFDQSLSIFRNIADLNNAAVALEGRARAELQLGNLGESRKNIEESLSLIETVRAHSGSQQLRAAYLASRDKAYEFYVDLLMQQDAKEPGKGHDAEALQASERGRARSLTEVLNEAHVDIQEGVSAELVMRERDLRQSLNAKSQRQIQLMAQKGSPQEIETLNKEISTLEDEYQQVQVAIRKASPAYAALTQPQPLNLREIQQQLDPSTVLLEYSLGEERSYLWAVTQNALKTYELPKREEIQKVAHEVYELLTARSVVKSIETSAQRQERIAQADAQLEQIGAELGKMVLAPAASELGTKRLVVVADGALQYVPFAALSVAGHFSVERGRTTNEVLTTDNGKPGYRPLIIDHEVVSLPSASAFAVQRRTLADRKPAPRALAVIADPVFSASDERFKASARTIQAQKKSAARTARANDTRIIEHLAESSNGQLTIRRLPFTRQEAEQILAVAPAASNLRAMDFRANRTTATSGELSRYRYVHFATHGYLDSARADLSAIVLSLVDEEGKPLDGFLRTLDIYNLKLPAEVVVLSACETGLGKDVAGEGLVGLTQGFMYAGARRVVVSLWNVNDKATADLMTKFYEKMLKHRERPAAALRAAQVEMWKQKPWQSPYYWAAFTMQGEWR